MREHIVNRHVHERGNNIHDGVQHDPRCYLPCSTSNRDASSVFLDKGGHPGVSICTFVLVKRLYFCTSKACLLCVTQQRRPCGVSICTFVLGKLAGARVSVCTSVLVKLAGAHFTCCTSAKVQILTREELQLPRATSARQYTPPGQRYPSTRAAKATNLCPLPSESSTCPFQRSTSACSPKLNL